MAIKRDAIRAQGIALPDLLQARDEAKVRIHLLSLEARQRWDEIETAILAIEQRATREGEHASEILGEKIRDLGQKLRELVAEHMASSNGLLASVRSLMTIDVVSCSPSEPLSRAAQLMWGGDCGIIPVTEQQRVVGLITDRDICMATYTQGKSPSELCVSSAMSSQVYGCAPDDSIGDALALMAERRLHRVPVLSGDGQLVGILSLADVARFARSAGSAQVNAALVDTLAAISKRGEPPAAAAEHVPSPRAEWASS